MLICPQCQFENPVTNKFCQQCGTSLTHKTCPECSTSVAYSAENCHNCGAFTGTLWWAIVSRASADSPVAIASPAKETQEESSFNDRDPEKVASAGNVEPIKSDLQSDALPAVDYLDSQQRYKLLEPMAPVNDSSMQVVRVLDQMPLQASVLEALVLQQQSIESDENDFNLNAQEASSIPAIALPYLELQEQFDPAIPKIHDAWIANDTQVLLLENRADWPYLVDLWRNETTPQMQLLHILYDMTSLWAALEPLKYCQSLLLLTNLRVDEDHTLVLQQLHTDPPDRTLTLQTLGDVWQHLFRQTGRTLLGSMGQLMSDLQTDTITSIEELRARLEAIATELQPDLIPTPAMLPVDPDPNLEVELEEEEEDIPDPPKTQQIYPGGSEGEDAPTVVLPMQLLSLEDAGRTDVGRSRRHNEDYFGIQTHISKLENPFGRTLQAKGLYILCDGMGGHAGGEVASALAVKTLLEYFQANWQDRLPDDDCIRKGVLHANQALFDLNQQDARSGSGRMGTTLVMVLVQDTQVAIAHVGDSRLYKISRTSGLEQLTVDHEVGQREILKGVPPEIAYARPDAYQLTQALGPRNAQFVIPDVQFFELDEDTLLLLCSDGLSDNDLIEKNWQTHLKPLISSRNNIDRGANDLIELANQHNGHDNITALLIRAKVRPDLEQARFSNGS